MVDVFIKFILSFSGSLSSRIIGGILVEVVMFIATVVLAMLDSSTWPGTFFWITMATVVILNSKFSILILFSKT